MQKVIRIELKRMHDVALNKYQEMMENILDTNIKKVNEPKETKTYDNIAQLNETTELIVIRPTGIKKKQQTIFNIKE